MPTHSANSSMENAARSLTVSGVMTLFILHLCFQLLLVGGYRTVMSMRDSQGHAGLLALGRASLIG